MVITRYTKFTRKKNPGGNLPILLDKLSLEYLLYEVTGISRSSQVVRTSDFALSQA